MSRDDQHFRLRLPADLREKVEAAAADSRRSLTAEILARLEQTFELDSKFGASRSPAAQQVKFSALRSPYYADHYLLLLGPEIADYLISLNEYEFFVRKNNDTLLRMDYKNEAQRLAARFLARDHVNKLGAKFPAMIDEGLFAASKNLSENRRQEEELAAKTQEERTLSRPLTSRLRDIAQPANARRKIEE